MRKKLFLIAALALSLSSNRAHAVLVGDLYKGSMPNEYAQFGPISITPGVFDNNSVRVYTLHEVTNPELAEGGASFVIAVSNGENGFGNTNASLGPIQPNLNTGLSGTTNQDKPNPTPVGSAIDIVNGGDGTQGHRLQNGNAFRFSLWIRHDPANPVTVATSVEPVLKFEVFSEAQSTNADYEGRKPSAAFGDRMWDTDLNATDPIYADQSRATFIDINNDGMNINNDPVISLDPAVNAWTRVETTIVLDDTPLDGDLFGWDVAGQSLKVEHIEEIRATFFTGDFSGDTAPFANGGRFFIDNALLEVFANKTDMLNTPNPNPMPVPAQVGDYNDDGRVNAADYTSWRNALGRPGNSIANRDPFNMGVVKTADFNSWRDRYGNGSGGAGGLAGDSFATIMAYAPGQGVPEPGTWVLCLMAIVGTAVIRHRR